MSFVHVGQVWYAFGWEIQLLETGFLAIFLCPPLNPRPFPRRPPPIAIIWLLRWLAFRIMLGAGLIKLRGDSCWRHLTCLYYHYETQPIPNPLSRSLDSPHFSLCVGSATADLPGDTSAGTRRAPCFGDDCLPSQAAAFKARSSGR
jgi:hypothetical protein